MVIPTAGLTQRGGRFQAWTLGPSDRAEGSFDRACQARALATRLTLDAALDPRRHASSLLSLQCPRHLLG